MSHMILLRYVVSLFLVSRVLSINNTEQDEENDSDNMFVVVV